METYSNTYFRDDGNGHQYISGWPLPSDDDGVVRYTKFVDCRFHPECQAVKFKGCIFENCDGDEKLNCDGSIHHSDMPAWMTWLRDDEILEIEKELAAADALREDEIEVYERLANL